MDHESERWLAAALGGVDPTRRARLRDEILDHLAEATAAHMARGATADEARAAALADLGDPRHTAAALRRLAPAAPHALFAATRRLWGTALLLIGLLLLALVSLERPLGLPPGDELGMATGLALVLQVATLTIAISLPLLFDDLDLSTGVLLMLGVNLSLGLGAPWGGSFVPPAIGGLALPDLPAVALVGATIGLVHGALVVGLRLPAAGVTLASGALVGAWMYERYGARQMALPSEARTVTLEPTIAVFALVCALLCLFWVTALALWRRPALAPTAAPTARERLRDLRQGVWLGLPLVLALGHVRLSWASEPSMAILAVVAGATAVAGVWISSARDAATRQARGGRVLKAVPWVAALFIALMLPGGGLPFLTALLVLPAHLLLLALLALPAAAAAAVIGRGVWASSGRAWVRPARATRRAALPRVAALALSGAVATGLGAYIGAQGMRDNTLVHATAFYVAMPLAGLLIGGQHVLPLWLRPLGALLGGLVVTIMTPMGSDNLDTAPEALLLAALFVVGWRLALPPPRLAAEPTPEVAAAPAAAELHRRLTLRA